MQCPTCNGARVIPTPNGQLYQACPLCDGSGQEFYEEFASFPFDVTLTASQVLRNQRVVVDGDADFIWRALVSTQQSTFRIRLSLRPGVYITSAGGVGTNDLVNNGNICGTAEFPFPINPPVVIPRAGTILFDLENLVAVSNTVQLAFHGTKRFPGGGTSQ